MSKRKSAGLLFEVADTGTIERQRHNGGLLRETSSNYGRSPKTRYKAKFECILDAYLWHGVITESSYRAGIAFAKEYYRSILRIKVDESGAGSHGDVEMPALSAISGNRRLKKAFECLTRLQCSILIDVCVYNHRAGTGRRRRYMCLALSRLAEVWGTT